MRLRCKPLFVASSFFALVCSRDCGIGCLQAGGQLSAFSRRCRTKGHP